MIQRMMIRQNQSPKDLLTAGSTDNKCLGVYVSNIQYNSAARYVQTCRRSTGSDLHERRSCMAKKRKSKKRVCRHLRGSNSRTNFVSGVQLIGRRSLICDALRVVIRPLNHSGKMPQAMQKSEYFLTVSTGHIDRNTP